MKLLSNLLITLLTGLRPMLGLAACKFHISCGNYAVLLLETYPLRQAIPQIAKRLLSCF